MRSTRGAWVRLRMSMPVLLSKQTSAEPACLPQRILSLPYALAGHLLDGLPVRHAHIFLPTFAKLLPLRPPPGPGNAFLTTI